MIRKTVWSGVCATLVGVIVGGPAAAAPAAPGTATVDVLGISGSTCKPESTTVRPSADRSSVSLQWWLTAVPGSPDSCTVEVEIRCAQPTGTVRVASEFIGRVSLAPSAKATIDVVTRFGAESAPPSSVSFRGPQDWQAIESEHSSPAPSSVSCAQPIRASVTSTQSVTGPGEGNDLSTQVHTISVA